VLGAQRLSPPLPTPGAHPRGPDRRPPPRSNKNTASTAFSPQTAHALLPLEHATDQINLITTRSPQQTRSRATCARRSRRKGGSGRRGCVPSPPAARRDPRSPGGPGGTGPPRRRAAGTWAPRQGPSGARPSLASRWLTQIQLIPARSRGGLGVVLRTGDVAWLARGQVSSDCVLAGTDCKEQE
jgi:hypothetical protein